MTTKKEIEELFFTPTVSKFQAISEDHNVIISNKHKTISNGKHFLGIKKTEFNNKEEIFCISHNQAHDLAAVLFNSMTGDKAFLFNYFHTEDLDWAAFLFTDDNNQTNKKNNENEIAQPKTKNNRKMPENIDIVIGVNSGYSDFDVPNFYLLLSHEFDNKKSFLTISNYKFTKDEIESYLEKKDYNILKDIITDKVTELFKEELEYFLEVYYLLESMNINEKDFVSVCLDLFNRNRSITSMRNDNNLLKLIGNLIHQSFVFSKDRGNLKCSLFINFIIRSNYFDIDNLDIKREKVEELFVQKRSYQKTAEIFPRFKKIPAAFAEYIAEQDETFKKINNEFKFI
jgi:hypothetical protein